MLRLCGSEGLYECFIGRTGPLEGLAVSFSLGRGFGALGGQG